MAMFPGKEGGAVVSIFGGHRGGKSVALAAAASVWAKPNELEIKGAQLRQGLSYLRNMPVYITTLANRDPQIAAAFISEMLVQPWSDFSTILLSVSGEKIDHPYVLEFHVQVPRGLIEPDKNKPSLLEQRFLDNRGNAGPAFLAYLLQPDVMVWAKKHLTSKFGVLLDDYGGKIGDTHLHRFKVRAIAAIWVAGIMCAQQGLLELSPERIARWAAETLVPIVKKERESS